MAREYASRILLEINGQEIRDFSSFKEGKREVRKQVNAMNHTGVLKTTPRPTVSLDYLIPKWEPEFDFESIEGGTITIDRLDGNRITFTEATFLDHGEVGYNADKEAVRPIIFHYDEKKEN